jgi:hypothetical protein
VVSVTSAMPICRLREVSLKSCVIGSRSTVKSFDAALEFDQQRFAFAIHCFACGHFDPTLADAVFLHIVTFFVIEANAYVMFKHCRNIVRAALVNAEVIGQNGTGCRVIHVRLRGYWMSDQTPKIIDQQ